MHQLKGRSTPLDPLETTYQLKRAGYTIAKLARELGMPRSTVAVSIYTGSSSKVRTRVAQILNCEEREIWPFRADLIEPIEQHDEKKPA